MNTRSALSADLTRMQLAKSQGDGLVQLGASKISAADRAQVGKLAEEFESVFLDLVFKSMRKTVPDSGFIEKGQGEEIFRDMLDSEYAKEMANQRLSGIASIIEKDLLKAMEYQANKQDQQTGQKVYGAQGLPAKANRAKID